MIHPVLEDIITMARVVEYILKVQKNPHINILELHEKQAKKIPKIYKHKIMFHLYKRYGIMVWEVECNTLIHTTYDAPNYKTMFYVECRNRTHQYMVEPMSTIRTIGYMRFGPYKV